MTNRLAVGTTSTEVVFSDGSREPLPRLRNGLVDGDALRVLLRYTGPTFLEVRQLPRQQRQRPGVNYC